MVEVRDLWPAIFVELGVLTNRWVIRVLEALEMAVYRAADLVVVVTEAFRHDLLRRGVPPEKVATVPNGADLERFSPDAAGEESPWRARLGTPPGHTLVLYAGAHGLSHGLVSIADAAAKLAGEPIRFAFVGEGAAKRALQRRVDELALDNVTLWPGVPRHEVPALLAAADVCLAPLRDVPLFSAFIPSKIFEYLAAGRPVVGAVRGEPARILQEAGALVVEPEDSAGLAGAVRDVAADPGRRAAMGRQGRRHVERHFDRKRLAARYEDLLAGVVQAKATP